MMEHFTVEFNPGKKKDPPVVGQTYEIEDSIMVIRSVRWLNPNLALVGAELAPPPYIPN